jgi:HPt (histidine-containing phosphotransfer) domain-containing protein
MVALFLDEAPREVDAIRQAADDHDPGAVRAIAHRLRGTCAGIGASRMAAIAHQIERSAEARDLTASDAPIRALDVALGQTIEALRSVGQPVDASSTGTVPMPGT